MLKKVLLTLAQSKVVLFNPDKCILGTQELPHFGNVITSDGLKPDSSKVKAIADLEEPDSRAKL